MISKNQNMKDWFRTNSLYQRSEPMNAWKFGLIIQDRRLTGKAYGLRKNHIPFQYLGEGGELPQWTKSANYEETQIIGRFEPIKTYTNSGDNKFTLNLMYYAMGTERLTDAPKQGAEQYYPNTSNWTIEQITRIAAKIESLVYPQYDGKYSPPRFCLLNIGSVFINYPVVVNEVTIHSLPPFSTLDLTPMRRTVSLSLTSFFPTYQPVSADGILKQALDMDFRTGTKNLPHKVYSYRAFKRGRNG